MILFKLQQILHQRHSISWQVVEKIFIKIFFQNFALTSKFKKKQKAQTQPEPIYIITQIKWARSIGHKICNLTNSFSFKAIRK